MSQAPRVFAVVLVLLVGLMMGVAVLFGGEEEQAGACGAGTAVDVAGIPAEVRVGSTRWAGEQLQHAAIIMRAGADAGVDLHGQTLGVNTAMGESTLINVNHGDTVGPDSTGLFQQRDPWGPRADRMDPYRSATMFFTGGSAATDGWEEPGLLDTEGWQTKAPTIAIHDVQRNADPDHYTRWWDDAVAVVAALSGADVKVLAASDGSTAISCTPPAGGATVGPEGWTHPTPDAQFTSGFGFRWGTLHKGVDLAAPVGTPIYAAAGGTVPCADNGEPVCAVVISAGAAGGFGMWNRVDHGDGVITVNGHVNRNLVQVGDTVRAGQQIAEVGNRGESTGPHNHFEVHVDGVAVDPEPWMNERGAPLRASP